MKEGISAGVRFDELKEFIFQSKSCIKDPSCLGVEGDNMVVHGREAGFGSNGRGGHFFLYLKVKGMQSFHCHLLCNYLQLILPGWVSPVIISIFFSIKKKYMFL